MPKMPIVLIANEHIRIQPIISSTNLFLIDFKGHPSPIYHSDHLLIYSKNYNIFRHENQVLFVQNGKNGVTKSRNQKDKSIMSLLIENIFIKSKKTATAIAKSLQMWYNKLNIG